MFGTKMERAVGMREFNMLVVDDDRIYLNLVKLFFEGAGLKVLCAGSGEEALEIVKEKPVRLLFTDYHMPPGMNGLELAGRFLETVPDARIVMITSEPSPEIVTLALMAGISRVTAKPCKLKEFQDIIAGEKQWLLDSLREGGLSDSVRDICSAVAVTEEGKEHDKEEKPSDGTGKEEHHGWTTWICPKCDTRYTGWSTLDIYPMCKQGE